MFLKYAFEFLLNNVLLILVIFLYAVADVILYSKSLRSAKTIKFWRERALSIEPMQRYPRAQGQMCANRVSCSYLRNETSDFLIKISQKNYAAS